MTDPATVYTISPGVPFVDALANGILARCSGDPLALADVTVLLPTRRACRALQDGFLRQSNGAALLLPKMVPLGDVEDEAGLSSEGGIDSGLPDALDLPPAISDLQRCLAIAAQILRADGTGPEYQTPASATELARALASLLDQVQTEGLSFDRLDTLVEKEFAAHWEITLEFLRLLTRDWPPVLEQLGMMDPATRRDRLARQQAARWRTTPPPGLIFAAGSTGSIPATAELLDVVANLPNGAVILPGFDQSLEDDIAQLLSPTHPQYGMVQLLRRLGLGPADIGMWEHGLAPACPDQRVSLIRHALSPPRPGGEEAVADIDCAQALAGARLIDCADQQEEAGVIALAMREAIETPGRTAALITPDRILARRVAAELGRWNINVDDSAGQPLATTPVGAFLRLAASCIIEDAPPVPLLSLLKHPLAACGMEIAVFRARVREFERLVLRGPRPAPGFGGLRELLKQRKGSEDLDRWLAALEAAAAPFAALTQSGGSVPLRDLVAAHIAFVEALAATDLEKGAERLWRNDDGEVAATFIAELTDAGSHFPILSGAAYPALLETLMAGRGVRPRYGLHPRLSIWGLLEARLQHADLICLGGLNEGVWPSEPGADPWMSRPMRHSFGLPPAERRIGLSAHDFVQSFSGASVLMTRAQRVDGTPTVPSRWLLLLENTLRKLGGEDALAQLRAGGEDHDLAGWRAALDHVAAETPIARPAPRPPLDARPRKLSVTQIETWMRDPYAIYARHILGLRKIDPIDADPGAADRGTMIHDALDAFVREHPDHLPDDMIEVLRTHGEAAFGDALTRPAVWAFWWPRFMRISDWFVAAEQAYREDLDATHTEVTGTLIIPSPGGNFTLTAKADRVDRRKDGTLSIIDYKTGALPKAVDIKAGFSPQLPLEAAIAARSGFGAIKPSPVSVLEYWRLTGGNPAGIRKDAGKDIDALAAAAYEGLAQLIAAFDDPDTPYLSQPDPERASRFSDYGHLARVQEWSSGGGEE